MPIANIDTSRFPATIFGVHDREGRKAFDNTSRRGWIVVSVSLSDHDSDGNFSELELGGFGVIARLNHGYNSAGTLPFANDYQAFARRCADFVANSKGAHIWIIGNETNLNAEWPGNQDGKGGEPITAERYAQCFALCYRAIKQRKGHEIDWIVPSAPAPYNADAGDFVQYFADMLNGCLRQNTPPDALALHAYTHGYKPELVTSDAKMDPPFQNYHYHFRVYQDFLNVVPSALRSVPVLITEAQPANPDWWQDENRGWVQAVYREINGWNTDAKHQPIQAVCLFRWEPGDDRWRFSAREGANEDFRTALQQNYAARWPSSGEASGTTRSGGAVREGSASNLSAPLAAPPVAQAAVDAAKQLSWLPVFTDGALYKFALAHGLGYPQTDEFTFDAQAQTYKGQVFANGVVYVPTSDFNQVRSAPKPTAQPPKPVDPIAAAATRAAQQQKLMPIDPNGSLYKFAQAKQLGYPQTDEFSFTVGGEPYRGQVFAGGIVLAKVPEWDHIQFVRKPA